jgi:hypothetical protein
MIIWVLNEKVLVTLKIEKLTVLQYTLLYKLTKWYSYLKAILDSSEL